MQGGFEHEAIGGFSGDDAWSGIAVLSDVVRRLHVDTAFRRCFIVTSDAVGFEEWEDVLIEIDSFRWGDSERGDAECGEDLGGGGHHFLAGTTRTRRGSEVTMSTMSFGASAGFAATFPTGCSVLDFVSEDVPPELVVGVEGGE